MKFLKLAALALAVLGVSSPVLAQSATQSVQVGVTLTSVCQFTSAAMTFTQTYTAFQTTDVTGSQNAALRCTRGATAPTLTWDTMAAGAPAVGLVQGLTYQLTATRGTITNGAAPNGTSVASLGTPATAPVAIDLLIPSGQAGATGAAAPVTRTLTVAF